MVDKLKSGRIVGSFIQNYRKKFSKLSSKEKDYFHSSVNEGMYVPLDEKEKTLLATKPFLSESDYEFLCNLEDIMIKDDKYISKK